MPSDKNQTTDFQSLREACRLANHYVTTDMARLQKLREILIENIKVHFPECIVHAQSARRLPGTISIVFPGIPGDVLITNCQIIAFPVAYLVVRGQLDLRMF